MNTGAPALGKRSLSAAAADNNRFEEVPDMVPIKDAHIRRLLLEYLVTLIEEGDLQALLDEGIEPELLDALRHRSVRDMLRVAEMPLTLGLTLDSSGLRVAFKRLDAIARDRRIVEYHIRHGAPPELMVRAFKLSGAELRAQRESLGAEFSTRGRPQLPPEKVRDAVHAAWAEIAAAHDEKERFMVLHQRFPDYSIGSLWHTVHEFDAATDGARVPRKIRFTGS